MDISIINIPIYYGADERGTEYAPQKLREKKISSIIEGYGHNVYDLGDIYVPQVDESAKYAVHPKLKYLDVIVEVNENLAHAVYSSLKAESFALIVGGDHCVAMGSMAGASRRYKNFAVIYMDAHGDINTHETTPSTNIHGMPLAASMNIGHEGLTGIYFEGEKVSTENVFLMGTRDLDEGEVELIADRNLNVFTADEIKEIGIEKVTLQIIESLKSKGIEAVHLSFDMDFIDGKYVPGTGLPVPGGIDVEDTKKAFKIIAESKLLKSMDLSELNVLTDKDDATADIAVELLECIFKYI